MMDGKKLLRKANSPRNSLIAILYLLSIHTVVDLEAGESEPAPDRNHSIAVVEHAEYLESGRDLVPIQLGFHQGIGPGIAIMAHYQGEVLREITGMDQELMGRRPVALPASTGTDDAIARLL